MSDETIRHWRSRLAKCEAAQAQARNRVYRAYINGDDCALADACTSFTRRYGDTWAARWTLHQLQNPEPLRRGSPSEVTA